MPMYSKVPMFRMKPHRGFLISAIVVFLLGALILYDGHRDPGDIPGQERSRLIFVICIVLSGLLFIVSTSRMWFKHLWHDRYR